MREDLIAYALGELNNDERSRVEEAIAADPALAEELEQIRNCLGDMNQPECDEPLAMPRGLADRTTAGILSECDNPTSDETHGWAATAGLMSPVDMTVAIGILITVGSLLLPAIYSSRTQSQQLSCTNNLAQIGRLLTMYSDDNRGFYPVVRPTEHVGIFASRLQEADYVRGDSFDQLFVCPASSLANQLEAESREFRVPSLAELSMASGMWATELQRVSSGSYGYHPGSVKGNVYMPAHNRRHSLLPVLADTPCVVSNYRVGANHGGAVVNTLFQDGSVRSLETPLVPQVNDHLFVNEHGEPSVGSCWSDAVVLPSGATPGVDFPTHQIPDRVYRIFFRFE